MRIAVVGPRDFNRPEYLFKTLDAHINNIQDIVIVLGNSKGSASIAKQYAIERRFQYLEFKADWKKFGLGADLIRTSAIVETCDVLIAFWDEKSKSTQDAINKAKKLNKRLIVMPCANNIS